MNWKTFTRPAGARRPRGAPQPVPTLLQNLLQPLMFVFVFGRVMTTAGMMPPKYKSMLLPGIMAMSMIMSGVWAVAMPLISEFQFTKEIEDRLLAPIEVAWVAVEKVVAGMLQALVAGWSCCSPRGPLWASGLDLSFHSPLHFRGVGGAGRAALSGRRTGVGLHRRADAHRPDVQPGAGAHDHVRMHLLSVERALEVPGPADGRPRSIRWSTPAKDCAPRWCRSFRICR